MRRLLVVLGFVVAITAQNGCATNPVTGKRELTLVSEGQEISLGQQNYGPARQMQGGDYTIDPDLTRYVQGIGQRLAAVSDRPELPYEFVVLNHSIPNAWAMPGGKIAINRGLMLELNSEAELAAVMGHEIVHAAARHGAKSMERGMLLQGALIGLQISQRDNQYGNYVVGGAQIGAMMISQKYGRNAELDSDFYGMKYMSKAGYDPAAAVELQETFVRLSEGRRTDWLSGLFSSHPPSQQRVDTNRETLAALGQGGDMGRERYQQAIAGLKRNKPAYVAFDEGVAAMQKGDLATTASLAQKAIDIEPRESKFYGLLGDSYLNSKDYPRALQYYNMAIQRNPNHFQPYLTSGIARQALGDLQAAEQDYQRSVRMLPTATAYHGLGMIALQTGRRQEAVKYLEVAASSDTEVGRDAGVTLAKLQMESNPEQYIQSGLRIDSNGYLVVLLRNQAPIAVQNIELELIMLDETGQRVLQRRPLSYGEALGAGQDQAVSTRIGPITDQAQFNRMRVQVKSAKTQ